MARYPTTELCDGDLLEAFEPTTRDSDIFCATAPKSGQTWLLALMYHLRSRGSSPDMGGRGPFAVMPWLELPFDIAGTGKPYERVARLAELEALEAPRIFKMHVVYEEIPRPPGSRSRVVTVTRDLCDLPYSMYTHMVGMRRVDPDAVSFDAYFEQWMEFGYAFKVVSSFWPHRSEPHVLWLRYEDMQADLRAQARRIVDFLGFTVNEQELDRALSLVTFERMQRSEDEQRAQPGARTPWREGSRFFREGGVGKNRARLSDAQRKRIVERARRELEPACYDFVMRLGDD